ncbi:MAG: hypothetical protein OEU26_10790 [Candidatus Tectomicrobia bacterium]|nr:hypothetical protein [Candidatus Tectomicrobia bacterium]
MRRLMCVLTLSMAGLAALLFGVNVISYILVDRLALPLTIHTMSKKLKAYPNIKSRMAAIEASFEEAHRPVVYTPFTGWTAKPFQGKTITVGQHGDRIHDHVLEVAPDQATIVRFFGGSTMWGSGVWDQETIPAYFDTFNPGMKAFNHGQQGHNARQELARLMNLYVQGETADIVIFYDGCNEIRCQARQLPTHTYTEQIRHAMQLTTFGDALSTLLVKHTRRLIQMLKHAVRPTTNRTCVHDAQFIAACRNKAQDIASHLLRTWEAAHALVTSQGGQFMAILQPLPGIGHPNTAYLDEPACALEMNAAVYDVIRKQIRESGHTWIHDFTHVLDGPEAYYFDICHVTSNGNLKIAQRMTELVQN